MSVSGIEIVKEFFVISDFYVIVKDSFLIVKNSFPKTYRKIENFIIGKEEIKFIDKAIVKPLSWHTLKFTPSVIKKFSEEIFEITEESFLKKIKGIVKEENYLKILVIPGVPATINLRNESIKMMKEKGIDYIILFPSIISGLIEKINSRHLYLSHTLEILRILKFYNFLTQEYEEKLPFKKK